MNKQSGFSLIEVLSVLGILAVVALGSSGLMVTQTKQVKRVDQSTSVNDFKTEVMAAQQVAATCSSNLDSVTDPLLVFDSTAPSPSLNVTRLRIGPDPSAAVLAEVNQEINGSGVAVDRITLGDLRNIGGTRWSGVWTIRVRQIDSGAPSFKEITFSPKVFEVNAAIPTAAVITSCVTASFGALPAPAWSTSGNAPVPAVTNYFNYFLGTTTDVDIVIRRNGNLVGLLNRSLNRTQMGVNSLNETATGDFLTAFGFGALSAMTTGYENVAVGSEVLQNSTTGNRNTAIGKGAIKSATLWDSQIVAVGANTINSAPRSEATIVGANALANDTFGGVNTTGVGSNVLAGPNASVGYTAFGSRALMNVAGGGNSVAVGTSAMESNLTGGNSVAIGFNALYANQTGLANVALGANAMRDSVAANQNTAAGMGALLQVQGDSNSSIGGGSLINTTTGSENTVAGADAMWVNTTGMGNVAVGAVAFATGGANPSLNTALGYQACISVGSVTNSTCIGANSTVPASNFIRLGDPAVSRIEGAVAFSTTSDARLKENIQNYSHGLDFILKLRPVSYSLISDPEKNRRSGFLAQEVESISIPFYGLKKPVNDKDFYALAYAEFVVPLVNAVQELYADVMVLGDELDALEEELDLLEATINEQNVEFKMLRGPSCLIRNK